MTTANQYNPDYVVPPGQVLEEHLEVRGLSRAEFARRCGLSPKLISGIISGKARIRPETALRFERVLGVSTTMWLGMEALYRIGTARKKESKQIARMTKKVKEFPINEMVRRGVFERPESTSDAVSKLLAFFGKGTIDAWHRHLENVARLCEATRDRAEHCRQPTSAREGLAAQSPEAPKGKYEGTGVATDPAA